MIDATQRRAADAWFLDRGLPAVLRPGALVRRLWPRSAPALAGFAVFMANSALVVAVTGKHTIDIYGHPTRTEWLPVSDMRQVHEWFLHRGLPLVLTRRVRSRALIERSSPWSAESAR
jgi:hypothetical protein